MTSTDLTIHDGIEDVGTPSGKADVDPSTNFRIGLAYSPLVISTIFAKVSVPPFGAQGIGITYPLLGILLLLGLTMGRVGIDPRRAGYFGIMLGIIGLIQVVREEPFSLTALVLMYAVTALFILDIPLPRRSGAKAFSFFINYCLFFAVLGLIQFGAQFVIGAKNAFPIETYLPAGFLIQGFHYLNPLYYGSSVFKANGVFLLEPSFFSQLLAIGLLLELTYSKRFMAIAIFVFALILSYSGTGILILAAGLPLVLISQRRVDLIFGLLGILLCALLFATPLKLDVFLERASEFSNPSSSAYIRFVSWYFLAQDALGHDFWRAIFGYGAGTFREISGEYASTAAEIFHSKLLIEYGLLGFLSYLGFLLYCIFSVRLTLALKVGAIVMIFMGGAFAEPITGVVLSLLLLAPRSHPRVIDQQPLSTSPAIGGKPFSVANETPARTL